MFYRDKEGLRSRLALMALKKTEMQEDFLKAQNEAVKVIEMEKEELTNELDLMKSKLENSYLKLNKKLEDLNEMKKVKNQLELDLERSNILNQDLSDENSDLKSEKNQIKNLVKVEFKEKLKVGEKWKDNFDTCKAENIELKAKIEAQDHKIDQLEQELSVKIRHIEQIQLEEQNRAQGLMEAVKLFVTHTSKDCIDKNDD